MDPNYEIKKLLESLVGTKVKIKRAELSEIDGGITLVVKDKKREKKFIITAVSVTEHVKTK